MQRLSFVEAADPEHGLALYERFCQALTVPHKRFVFGAHMMIDLVADGPVTLLLDRD